jgi:hypothetical protein
MLYPIDTILARRMYWWFLAKPGMKYRKPIQEQYETGIPPQVLQIALVLDEHTSK